MRGTSFVSYPVDRQPLAGFLPSLPMKRRIERFMLIQPLESRVLFSAATVTATALTADKTAVLADAATLKADAKTTFGTDKLDPNLVAAGFALLPATVQTLLKPYELDAAKSDTVLSADISNLLNTSSALIKKSVVTGDSLLSKPTVTEVATLEKELPALNAITAKPVADLQTELAGVQLSSIRDIVLVAFPADSALINAVYTQATSAATGNSTLVNDAAKYQTDIAKLAADLTTIQTEVGTFPNLIGTFSGTATLIGSKQTGTTDPVTLTFTSESATTGKVTATVTDLSTGEIDMLTGSITLGGKLSLKAKGDTVTGIADGTSLVGKFAFAKIHGVFALSE